jgi:putative membrane protein
MRKAPFFLLLFAASLLLWSFIHPQEKTSPVSCSTADQLSPYFFIEPDSVFVLDAASSGKMEVTLGTMAQEKGSHQRVKDFGAMMVRDHTAANQELVSIAATKNYPIPDSLLPKHQRHVDHLNGLNGTAFDRAYMDMMVEAHKDDIDEFEDASKKAKDTDVKAFAAKQLPILTMHRDTARSIRSAL